MNSSTGPENDCRLLEARKPETNLAASTQRVMIGNLNQFSRQVKKELRHYKR
jgi:hypothetical protein